MHAEQTYLFRHALLRDAAYQLQMPADRALLHELTLEIMERVLAPGLEAFAEELADHARLAQADNADASLFAKERAYTLLAARTAESRFMNEKSAALWERAAALDEPGSSPRLDALAHAGQLWFRCGRPEPASRVFESGMAEAGDSSHEGALLLAQNRLSMFQTLGRADDVLAQGTLLAEKARAAGNVMVELRVRYLLINARIINSPDYSPVDEYEPLAARAEAAGEHLLAVTIRASYGNSLRNMNRCNEAEAILQRCIETSHKAGFQYIHGVALGYLGHVFNQTGRFDDALKTYDACLLKMRELGDQRFLGIFISSRGTLLRKMGRLEESLEHYETAQRLLHEAAAMEDLANVLLGRATLEFARKNAQGGREACAQSEAISNRLNQPQRAELARLRLAELEGEWAKSTSAKA